MSWTYKICMCVYIGNCRSRFECYNWLYRKEICDRWKSGFHMILVSCPWPIFCFFSSNVSLNLFFGFFIYLFRSFFIVVYLSASKFSCDLPPLGHNLSIGSAHEVCAGKEGKVYVDPHAPLSSDHSFLTP
jgi:hypothetical protein